MVRNSIAHPVKSIFLERNSLENENSAISIEFFDCGDCPLNVSQQILNECEFFLTFFGVLKRSHN